MPLILDRQTILYPEDNGEPFAENTLQYEYIVTIKEGLEALFAHRDDVFIAADLLWYPAVGRNRVRVAPDTMVVFGRPKGYRGFYLQWEEDNIPPQVVFEILSPGNTTQEMLTKLDFYNQYGVEEYYLYDPQNGELCGWHCVASEDDLLPIEHMRGWVSPRLGIRFDLNGMDLVLYRPDGEQFKSYTQLMQERDAERSGRLAAEERVNRLAEKLRSLGVDPDTV